MTKGRIIYAVTLLAVLSAFGAVYQFYLKEKLEAYHQDELLKKALEDTYSSLAQTFSNTSPEKLVQIWKFQSQPWNDALEERSKYFTAGDWFDHESPPKEGVILKVWYEETSNKMIWKLYEKVGEKMAGRYDLFPGDIRGTLGVPSISDWAGQNVTEDIVNAALGRLSYGIKVCDMLLAAKASSIRDIVIWPERVDREGYSDLLRLQTLGLSFTMTSKDLVNFLEENLRLADRYFNVDALRISYDYIAYPNEPHLNVEMLLTQAMFNPRSAAPPGGGAPVAAPGMPPMGPQELWARQNMQGMRPRSRRYGDEGPPPEPGFFGKAWKLFKRYVLYSN